MSLLQTITKAASGYKRTAKTALDGLDPQFIAELRQVLTAFEAGEFGHGYPIAQLRRDLDNSGCFKGPLTKSRFDTIRRQLKRLEISGESANGESHGNGATVGKQKTGSVRGSRKGQ